MVYSHAIYPVTLHEALYAGKHLPALHRLIRRYLVREVVCQGGDRPRPESHDRGSQIADTTICCLMIQLLMVAEGYHVYAGHIDVKHLLNLTILM